MNDRIRFEREMESLQVAQSEFDNPQDAPKPVLVLDEVVMDHFRAPFVRNPAGLLRAIFCKPFSVPSILFVINGHVEIEEKGTRRAFQKADHKTFPRLKFTPWIRAKAGVNATAGHVAAIKNDGTFSSTSTGAIDKSARRISIRADLEWKRGKVSVEAAIDYSEFECFLKVIHRHERLKPANQSNFEFLSSVRKMFQPAAGSPLEGLFPLILDRTKKVKRLEDLNSGEGKNIRRFETLEINGPVVDIGHALVGIEAHRRQKPGAWGLPVAWPADEIESFLTWIGDLGGVLAWVAQETPLAGSGPKPDIKRLLSQKASYEDLRGDLDGVNLGAIYDESLGFGENLRKYYDAVPFRRYRSFIANARDSYGKPVFKLTGARVDPAGRTAIAAHLQMFTHRFLMNPGNRKFGAMTDPQQRMALDIGRVGSKESNTIIDYFYNFLNTGLASEP